MSQRSPALQLFSDIWRDINEDNFFWQVVVLVVCLGAAYLLARWWRRQHAEGAGRLGDAGARLVFPLTGMILLGLAYPLFKSFIHINMFKLALPLLGAMALVRSTVFVLRQAFPRALWLTTWERIIGVVVWSWLALYITDLAPYAVDVLAQIDFTIGQQTINLWMILHGLFTVFLTVLLALWLGGLVETRLQRIVTLDSSLRIVGVRVAKALLTVIAIATSLSLVGIDMTALSVFTGALGVGLGFGLQKIASNYVSGFIILLDRSIRIGNIIQVGEESGLVTQITTRYTVLKHPGGMEYIVPNETLIGSVVQNQTYSDTSLRLVTSVGVAYDSDLELVMRLMVEVAVSQPRVLADPEPRVFLTQFADSSINLELGFWIADPEAGKGNIISDINLALWKTFREHGVEIPFPQRDVRIIRDQPAI